MSADALIEGRNAPTCCIQITNNQEPPNQPRPNHRAPKEELPTATAA
jgi:hypothetical protein